MLRNIYRGLIILARRILASDFKVYINKHELRRVSLGVSYFRLVVKKVITT